MNLMIRVTDKAGNDMYLRHGATPGEGQIVRFPSRATAERQAKAIEHGLDAGDAITIVPYDSGQE